MRCQVCGISKPTASSQVVSAGRIGHISQSNEFVDSDSVHKPVAFLDSNRSSERLVGSGYWWDQ